MNLNFIEKIQNLFISKDSRRPALLKLLSGSGIEIGPLDHPIQAPHLDIKFVDRMTVAELREQYPELANNDIVEPDIIDNGETLDTIADNSQDFVVASHVIEHIPNPIQALLTWQRVLKPGGRLFLAAPASDITFDRTRELTSIKHLLEDYQNPSRERDYAAFEEFALHVSCRHFGLKPESEYKDLAKELWEQDYSIHYHVWTYKSFKKFLDYLSSHFDNWHLKVVDKMPTCCQEFAFVLEKQIN